MDVAKTMASLIGVCLMLQAHAVVDLKYSPATRDGSSIGMTEEEYWRFIGSSSDEFSGTSLNSNKWAQSYDGWNGIPPAAYSDSNVDPSADGRLKIFGRVDGRFDFSQLSPAEGCECGYEEYTTAIVTSKFDFSGSDAWAIEVRAKPALAAVRSNIWLQGTNGEFSAFEMKGMSDGQSNHVCRTAFHSFNDEETTNTHSYLQDLCNPGSYVRYGMMWKNGVFSTSINGQNVRTTDLGALGGFNDFTDNFKLIMDVFVNATDELSSAESLPAFLNVDYVRTWTLESNYGYSLEQDASKVCDPKSNARAVTPRVLGNGVSMQECAAKCNETIECNFFTLNKAGTCFFFKDCNNFINSDTTRRFDRLLETNPAPNASISAIEGYKEYATDELCDVNAAENPAVPAVRKSVPGSGNTLEECAAACDRQLLSSCAFFTLSNSGYCKMFASCASTRAKNNMVIYKRDRFKLLSLLERCDNKAHSASYRSLGGGGHTEEECLAACDSRKNCGFAVFLALKGFCHLFSGTCTSTVAAKAGSRYWVKVGGAEIPQIPGYSREENICDKDDVSNIRSGRYSLGGGGHSFLACTAACTSRQDCNFFLFSNTGFCNMFETCPVRVASTNKIMYAAAQGYTLDLSQTFVSDTKSQNSTTSYTGVLFAIGVVGAVVGAVLITKWKRAQKSQYSKLVESPDHSEHLMSHTVAMYSQ